MTIKWIFCGLLTLHIHVQKGSWLLHYKYTGQILTVT